MAHFSKPEHDLIPVVEAFGEAMYPDCLMIFHPTVYWADGAMSPFHDAEAAQKVLTPRSTGHSCEVIPDYAFFRRQDILGACFKKDGTKCTERSVAPDSPEFLSQIRKTKPISYIWHDEPDHETWYGRRCVVRVRRGARAVAVVDHKGGKTHNSAGQRRKVLYQAERFGTQNCFILIPSPPPEPMKLETMFPVERVMPELHGAEMYRILKTLW